MSDKTDAAKPDKDRAALARKAAGLRRNGCTVDQIHPRHNTFPLS